MKNKHLIFLCILICVFIVLSACQNDSEKSQGNDEKLFRIDYSDVQDETVRFFRQNIVQRDLFYSFHESPITKKEHRHASDKLCRMCGKHTDLIREDTVNATTIEAIDIGMRADEVFTLIGNAHFGFLDPESAKDMIASSSVGVDEDFFFYYILSSGDVLEIQYDKKTNCVCKLRQITGVEFIALYPADHSK